jgi:hypothetical protein
LETKIPTNISFEFDGDAMKDDLEYVTAKEAAEFLRCTTAGLARQRHERRGPPFLRVSNRVVRYRLRDLRVWLESHRVEPQMAQRF